MNNINAMQYDIENEPIVISKSLMDKLFNSGKFMKLFPLYSFYYYTAKWQKTNQVKATDEYTAKRLKISKRSVLTYRKELIELGLVEKIINKSETNQILGHYYKINFVWTKASMQNLHNGDANNDKSHNAKKPQVANLRTNALSTIKRNALSSSSRELQQQQSSFSDSQIPFNNNSKGLARYNPQSNPPNPEDIIQYGQQIGFIVTAETAQKFIDEYLTTGWKYKGQPMLDWRPRLRAWKVYENNFKPKEVKNYSSTVNLPRDTLEVLQRNNVDMNQAPERLEFIATQLLEQEEYVKNEKSITT